MTENDHFTLVFRQKIQHLTNAVMTLFLHHLHVGAFFGEVDYLKDIAVIARTDRWRAFHFAEMVNTEVVRNTHSPGKEFSFFCVTSSTNGVNDFDENILENILGQIFVFYQEKNGSVHLVFVTQY